MSYFFILTSSVFLNWLSELEYEIPKSAKKLLTELKQISSINKEVEVKVCQETDSFIKTMAAENLWIYKFVKAHYNIEQNSDGDEITAVVSLAKLKSKVFDEVIIVNGSNCYDLEDIKQVSSIKVFNETKALDYIKTHFSI